MSTVYLCPNNHYFDVDRVGSKVEKEGGFPTRAQQCCPKCGEDFDAAIRCEECGGIDYSVKKPCGSHDLPENAVVNVNDPEDTL